MSEQVVNGQRTGQQVLESIESSIEKLVAITQRPVRKRESDDLRELYKALAAAQRKFSDIHKSGIINGRNIPYAKINDLVDASRAALAANGLVSNTFSDSEGNGYSILITRLYHPASGQFMDSVLPLLNNMDEQKRGSSITYSWRYTYAPLMGLVDNSCDDDGDVAKPVQGQFVRK